MGRHQRVNIIRECENAAISGTTDAYPVFQLMLSVIAQVRPHTLIMWKADSEIHLRRRTSRRIVPRVRSSRAR